MQGNTKHKSCGMVNTVTAMKNRVGRAARSIPAYAPAGLLLLAVMLLFTACPPEPQAPPTYTVTYDGNGNTGGAVPVDDAEYAEGDTVTVLGNTGGLAKTGSSFAGWNTASDGSGTDFAAGSTLTMGAGDVVLYAKWTADNAFPDPPAEVSDFSISQIGAGEVTMSWTDPSDNDLDHIAISVDPADIGTETVNAGTEGVTLSGLTTEKSYTIALKSVDSEGNASSGKGITVYIPASSTAVTFISNSSGSALNSTLAGDLAGYYILGTDVDLDGVTWTTVGTSMDPFTGTFDGGGHTVSNLTINASATDYQGLFGFVAGGTLANAAFKDVSVTGQNYVGSLAGWIDDTTVTNCSAAGSITGADGGGLVGHTENGSTISNCYSSATVTTGTGDKVGGLVGYMRNTSISKSYATGTVTGTNFIGGLTGGIGNLCSVSQCYATGTVGGPGTNSYVGGLVGINESSSTIANSYSTGSVEGNDYIGGLVGYSYSTITNSYATGSVSGSVNYGGLVSVNNGGTVTDCFYDEDTTGMSDTGKGYPTSTTNMKDVATFTDTTPAPPDTAWDFVDDPNDDGGSADIWSIDSTVNSGYPYLTDLKP